VKLNLGCNDNHLAGFVNVDICPPADMIVDLRGHWPWFTDSIEHILANDVLEHLPDKIHSMNEAHRVLKLGGRLEFCVPTTDGRGAWQDPTHKSFWTPYDYLYFCPDQPEWKRFHGHYGITAQFKRIKWEHKETYEKVWKLYAILETIK
jgi:predicted SAM-dependent methyltransferase